MSILNIFKSQLSDVIEWENQNPAIVWYKYPSDRNEIINASKLILAPSQGCILVYEGKIVDILEAEGTYNLKTDNHPFITTLINLRQNFESEHKLYIYFYQRSIIVNQNWGTANPIKFIDPNYKIPVELGLNGIFAFQITNARYLYENIVTNQPVYYAEQLRDIIINKIPTQINSYIATAKLGFKDIDSNTAKISEELTAILNKDFEDLGLKVLDFKITGTQYDDETIKRIGKIADMTTASQEASEVGMSYQELERLKALRDAAKNEGGVAGLGAQLGVGMEIGKLFDFNNDLPTEALEEDFVEKLRKLQVLLKEGIITEVEFEELKKQILNKL